MKLYHKLIFVLFYIIAASLLVYSYVLVDPNITFINNKLWAQARELLVQFGYYQRQSSSYVFLILITALFGIHFYFVKNYKSINLLTLIIPLSLLGVFSYPFLSHDLFNYMFDAKILTYYHQNPYLHSAMDFNTDPWLRFLQWTHRTYPYGPVFLLISIVPSFLSFGKFILSFIFFKTTFALFYILTVWILGKLNKQWAVFFATSPLVIIEGLVNSHNDLIGVSLAIIGVFYLFKKSNMWARIFLLLSGGIKYITLPLLILVKDKKSKLNMLTIGVLVLFMIYLTFRSEIQPWYFLSFLVFLPFYPKIITLINTFFAGLLFSYYPYIRFGDWGMRSNVQMKHNIILAFFVANLIYLFFKLRKESKA